LFTCIIKIIFLVYQNHLPKNQIFRPNSSLFHNSGRPAQGGAVDRYAQTCTVLNWRSTGCWTSRPAKPGAHGPVSVDRQSTDRWPLVHRQSTGSRPAKPGAHAFCTVDRQSTVTLPPFITPVDRQLTGSRPTSLFWAKLV